MKLFYISQTKNDDYDSYDSAVVAAESMEDAVTIHPNGTDTVSDKVDSYNNTWTTLSWIKAQYIGEAAEDVTRGVICASFNAG